MVSLDYKLTPGTTIMLYGMYNTSKNDYNRQSKNYAMSGAGAVGYSFETRPDNTSRHFTDSAERRIQIKISEHYDGLRYFLFPGVFR